MGWDLKFMLGADPSEFKHALHESEGSVNKFSGNLGAMLREQTHGIHQLGRAISVTMHTMEGVFTGFGLFALVGEGIHLIQEWRQHAEEAAEAARKELERRREVMELVDKFREPIEQNSLAHREHELEKDFLEKRSKLAKETLAIEKQIAEQRSIAQPTKIGDEPFFPWNSVTPADRQEAEKAVERLLEEEGKIFAKVKELEQANRERVRILEEEVAKKRELMDLTLDQADAVARGEKREADLIGEQIAHAKQLEEIKRLAESMTNEQWAKLEEKEDKRHADRLKQIDAEEKARLSAIHKQEEEEARRAREEAVRDAERVERERRMQEDRAFRNASDEDSMELERLKLERQDKAARLLEAELQHKRRVHDIETREGIDDSKRIALLKKEAELDALRMATAGAEDRKHKNDAHVLGIGFGGDRLLRQQVLGSSRDAISGARAAREQRWWDESEKSLKRIQQAVDIFSKNRGTAAFG